MTPIDVLVITALKEEFEAACEVALATHPDSHGVLKWEHNNDDFQTPYLFGKYVVGDTSFNLAIARPTRMGGTSTAPIASSLVERLKPSCLSMCGVCAGNPKDMVLGDVIIAEIVYAYDEGKRNENSFEGDHRQVPMHATWLRSAQDLNPQGLPSFGESSDEEAKIWLLEQIYLGGNPRTHLARSRYFPEGTWAKQILKFEAEELIIREGFQLKLTPKGISFIEGALFYNVESPAQLPFQIKVGPIASGNVVVKDNITWNHLKQWGVRTVLGLEMEAASMGAIAQGLGVPRWIVVKGVMDHADPRKDDRYKSFAARASAEVLFKFLELQFIENNSKLRTLENKRVSLLQESENIFQTAGALPYGHKTYIDRICDNDFEQLLSERQLIVVSGEFQIGKSSLINQINRYLPKQGRVCYLNVMAMRVDDPRLFITGFFQSLSANLSTNIGNWDEVAKFVATCPLVVLIDEFGTLSINREIAQLFIQQIIDLTTSSNIKVVACLPSPAGTIEDFLRAQNITNPKYLKYWRTIKMKPLTQDELVALLSLLPKEVFSITMRKLKIIISKTKGYPQSVQCLCRTLFDNYKNGVNGDELSLLIDLDDSYND